MMMIRGRDGGTKCILRIKEKETSLTLQEHDDDDDETRKTKWAKLILKIYCILTGMHDCSYEKEARAA